MAFDSRRWRSPYTLSAFAEVPGANVPALRAGLAACRPDLRLEELPAVHFLRLFLIDADEDLRGRPLPARLVVSAVFDGSVEDFLAHWVDIAGDALAALLGLCVGGPTHPDEVAPFLLQHAVLPDTFHIGAFGTTMEQILEEDRLARELRGFIDAHFGETGPSVTAAEVRERALAFVRGRPDLPQGPRPGRSLGSRIRQAGELLRTVTVGLALPGLGAVVFTLRIGRGVRAFLPALVVGTLLEVGLGFGIVRYLELTEADVVVRQDDERVAALEEDEDFIVQNQFTMVAPVRDSLARRLILRATLFLSDEFSKHFSTQGRLVGVETIHFARIHQIDGGRRFLFMSDFDGGWNRYLFDFLTTGAFAVVPNWTNLLGCPKTKFLLNPQAGFAQRFLPFTRAQQLRSDVWYSALPGLTVGDVLKHADIRSGLFSGGDAARWVRLL
jgi:hypothetical protein